MPYTCVVVEDQAEVSHFLAQHLIGLGKYTILGMASDIKTAEVLLNAVQPDLVLLDVYLPDGNGLDLLQKLNVQLNKSEVLLLTAAKEVKILEKAIKLGVSDFLVKPILLPRFELALKNFELRQKKLSETSKLTQNVVDQFFSHVSEPASQQRLPKGVDGLTLEQIRKIFRQDLNASFNAEMVGKELGISRSTARRYLEYLVNVGELKAQQRYGSVGRPQRHYENK